MISLTLFSCSFSRCLHSSNRLLMKESHGNNDIRVIQCCFCNKTVNINMQQPFILTTRFKNVLQSAIQIWLVHSYFEESSVFPHDRVPNQQVNVNKSAIENRVEKFGITDELDMSTGRQCLKSPQSLSGTSVHPTIVRLVNIMVMNGWLTSFSFHVNQPSQSWDKAI